MSADATHTPDPAGTVRTAAGRPARTRRRIATAVVAAATVSGLALTSVPAFADGQAASPLGIGRATTDSQEHGTFSVPVWSDDAADPVTAVTAVVRDGSDPVGDPITLVPAGTSGAAAETWTLPQDGALKLTADGGRMPRLGRYALDVTATDAHGATLARADAGTLDFTLVPKFDGGLVLNPGLISYGQRRLTVSGTLVGVRPGSGAKVPLAGRDVAIDEAPWGGSADHGTLHAETGPDGAFTTAVTLDDVQLFTARYAESSAEVHGGTSYAQVPSATQTDITVTGAADHARVLPGKTFKVSGVVRKGLSASSSAPLIAAAQVTVALNCSDAGFDGVRTVTDATGHYSVTLAADPECYSWSAYGSGPFVGRQTPASGQVAFPDTSSVTGVSSAIGADGYVTVTGRLVRTYHRLTPYSGENTALWYSRDGRTGWRRLQTGRTDANGAFRLALYGYVDGYYQVRHTDTDVLAASSGPAVRLTRTDTRVVTLKASRTRKVGKNTAITVTGTLQQWTSGAWRSYGRQHVELFFLPKGGKRWQYKGAGTTAANGRASLKAKPTADGKWLIQYFGDSRHFDSGATAVFVDVL